ncbi:antA/AntB antirepressor family protein [Spirosoma sp. 48-14]|uniref:antA/AntB antirepressor family protein n=1 Tax=Spirosoma sp. 48-14 TaxID=1895854 RepID=UPI000964A7E7|nr:antA/AntB antirepressor family protein [Spirosoma sp. 48-14]OJW78450.1 MAG: hypothetical protein BGO59_31090 [Spirosoma sp. 48-14]
MNEIVKITTDAQGLSVVSARELHRFLEAKTKFADWIKARIIKYGFLEGTDYLEVNDDEGGFSEISEKPIQASFTNNLVKPNQGGRPTVDYALTLDMAKELAMVENNDKGREARKYFIEAEKQLRKTLATPSTEQVLIQLVSQNSQLLANQQQILINQQQAIGQLRADVDSIMRGHRPPKGKLTPRLITPPKKVITTLRQLISRKVNDYCAFHGAEQSETYNYLYKRMHDVYGVNVHRLQRKPGEYILDAIERYGHLDRLYSLIMAELNYNEDN